ncbi:MAG: hypothetical protein ACUVQG_04450 [Thermogutta sp.]
MEATTEGASSGGVADDPSGSLLELLEGPSSTGEEGDGDATVGGGAGCGEDARELSCSPRPTFSDKLGSDGVPCDGLRLQPKTVATIINKITTRERTKIMRRHPGGQKITINRLILHQTYSHFFNH